MRRLLLWRGLDEWRAEAACVELDDRGIRATGTQLGVDPVPYRLDYELETEADFVTSRLRVVSRGDGWRRELQLGRAADGDWSIVASEEGRLDLPHAGGNASDLAAALDCDLGLSPVTNTMPILRYGLLHGGGPVELTMAWVAVPALAVEADGQRYRHLESMVVRFEAVDGSFAADITVDDDGVVVDYPGIARRLDAGRSGD